MRKPLFFFVSSSLMAMAAAACGGKLDLAATDAGSDPGADGGVDLPDASTIGSPEGGSVVDASPAPDSGRTTDARSWIVFDSKRDGKRHVYAVRVDGAELHKVTDGAGEWEPAVSWDGARLAYTAADGVRVTDLGSGTSSAIPGTTGGAQPAWSPDGTLLAFQKDKTSLWVTDVTGARARQIASPPAAWAPWGSPVFTSAGTIVADRYNALVEMTADGKPLREVVPQTTTKIAQAALSPDGKRIAFITMCGDSLTSVWASDFSASTRACVDGTRETPSLEGSALHPTWGPGNTLVFELYGGLYQHVVGSNSASLVVSGDAHGASWAPPGAKL